MSRDMSEAWSSLRTCIAGCHCLLEGGQCAKMQRGCASVCVLAHESERRAVEAESVSGTADLRCPTVVMKCRPRRGCRCNTAEARYGHHDLVFTARQFSVGDCARLSAAWVLFFCLLTIMVVVVAAAPQASSRRRSKVRRVRGRVRDPEAHWLCAEGRHIALGGGGGIRTLRERR